MRLTGKKDVSKISKLMSADSSLTPSVALLVCPRGTIHSIVDCHEFTGSHDMPDTKDCLPTIFRLVY